MKSDIEIAQEAKMKPITEIAAQLGLSINEKRWCEPLLSSLSCKLGSGKTRRKENAKEESYGMRFEPRQLQRYPGGRRYRDLH